MSEATLLSRYPSSDVIIVGSGMGGATLAAGLAPTGARIVILERGEQLQDTPEARDARAIFQRGFYRPTETWTRRSGPTVQPRQLLLCRRQHQVLRRGADPIPRAGFPADSRTRRERRRAGRSPTTSWSLGIRKAESLYRVRGELGDDPTEPRHSAPYPLPAGPGRAGDRGSPRTTAASGTAPRVAAARRRHRVPG